jgi:hypothetical protein
VIDRLEGDVRRELARFGPAAGIGPIVEAWPAAVGEAIARNAWPARLARDGTLVVHTQDSVWAFELTQRAVEIRERLGELAPKALKFVAGPVPEPPAEEVSEALPSVPRPGPDEFRLAEEVSATIGDENLRKMVAKAAALSLARSAAGRFLW